MNPYLDRLLADRRRVEGVVRAATGSDGAIAVDEIDADPVPLTNMTTTALARACGRIGDSPWSFVIKIVQSPDESPIWSEIPSDFHEQVLRELQWRTEPQLYRSSFGNALPPEMRLPHIYGIDDLDDSHLAIWMESVEHRTDPWSLSEYAFAGRAMGRMWARLRDGTIPSDVTLSRRDLRGYFFGRVSHGVLPGLSSDETWKHPVVAESADPDLRADLFRLAERAPAILERMDTLPFGISHGDACPQNLLFSSTEPTMIVAIDWQLAGLHNVGYDVAQILAGRAESGDLDPDTLEASLSAALNGYVEGLDAEGADVAPEDVRYGAISALTIRSAFTAVPLELLGAELTDRLARVVRNRCRYARFLVDLAATL